MAGKYVNKTELAEIFGKSQQTITTWQKNGLPIEREGQNGTSHTYDTAAVLEWWYQWKLSKLNIAGDGQVYDYDAERARLTHHQANKTALEEEVLAGKLIPADIVEQDWLNMITAMRAKLLSLPTKLASVAMSATSLREVQDFTTKEIHEALHELSADTDNIADSFEAAPIGSESGETAAAAAGF